MKMNLCLHKYDLIAYRLNMLDPVEHKLIEEHMAVCPQCQQAMQIELEIDKDLSTPMDPGHIEDIVIRKLRMYKEMATGLWWQYPLRVCLNTLAGFAVGFGVWIFIDRQFNNISWLSDLVNAMENNINTSANIYIISGFSIVFLLASVLFAFRKNVLKYIIEL